MLSTKVFMLIETAAGKAEEVTNTLQKYKEIKSVDAVAGLFDVIAVVEQDDLKAIGKLIVTEIPPISDINNIMTCISVHT